MKYGVILRTCQVCLMRSKNACKILKILNIIIRELQYQRALSFFRGEEKATWK